MDFFIIGYYFHNDPFEFVCQSFGTFLINTWPLHKTTIECVFIAFRYVRFELKTQAIEKYPLDPKVPYNNHSRHLQITYDKFKIKVNFVILNHI